MFMICLLTFVVEVFGSRRKYTLSTQEIPRHMNSKANLKLNFSNRDNSRTGRVKANYFAIIRGLPEEK